jgi:hypothetical protein
MIHCLAGHTIVASRTHWQQVTLSWKTQWKAGHNGMQNSLVGHTSMQKIWQADQTSEQNPLAGRIPNRLPGRSYKQGRHAATKKIRRVHNKKDSIRSDKHKQTGHTNRTQASSTEARHLKDSQDDCATKRRITECRITKRQISKRRIAQCRIEKRRITKRRILQNVESYKRQNTKCWILQNVEIQNVESYRT